jgi:UPF0176 protein
MFKIKNQLNKEECKALVDSEDFKRTTLSYYRYVSIENAMELRDQLFLEWSELGVLGRVYLASEGINAQVSVPSHNLEAYKANLETHTELAGTFLNIALEHHNSFIKLCIKVKDVILADGIAEGEFDLENPGKHLSAQEVNDLIDGGATVYDMRNHYESRIGKFEGAITPDCDTFEEEVPMVLDMMKGKEDENILLYCTGGIRCEKVSSYYKKKGFKNVHQIKGGIINYAKQCKEEGLESKFKGANFVFDERMAERVTEDVLGECDQCATSCDAFTNCENKACNLLFIQCSDCMEEMDGTCTPDCKEIMQLPEEERKAYYAKQKSSNYKEYVSRIRPWKKIKAKV